MALARELLVNSEERTHHGLLAPTDTTLCISRCGLFADMITLHVERRLIKRSAFQSGICSLPPCDWLPPQEDALPPPVIGHR
eukprot:3742163-Pyramimonas_sp.AAC.1